MYHSFGRVMQKLYTKNIVREQLFFAGVIVGLFLIGALLFHPSLHIFQFIERKQKLTQLIKDIQKPDFSMREYWQFREFYSAGNFSFNPKTVTLAGALQFNEIVEPRDTLLTFNSPKLKSNDELITLAAAADIPELHGKVKDAKVLAQFPDRVVFETADGKTHFLFLRSTDEMLKTLGLFDYGNNEMNILKGKAWLNETTISP